MSTLILHTDTLNTISRGILKQFFPQDPHPYENHHRLSGVGPLSPELLLQLRTTLPFDINPLPAGFDPKRIRLVISDMDSTLINIECIDEIADFAGVKPQVAAITEAAMRGELDFAASLTQRVATLKGLDEAVLQTVYDERLRPNPGAERLIAGLKVRDIRFALVSGGFTFFTDRLKSDLGIDYTRANTLQRDGSTLTGRVEGAIVDATVKAEFLQELCNGLGIEPEQAIAMGDGANDLKMMALAGIGVAYRAKPKVQAAADVALNHSGLDAVLDLLA